MTAAPAADPMSAFHRPPGAKAWGSISTTTRASMAPAAKVNDSGSSPVICSTARKAATAPTG